MCSDLQAKYSKLVLLLTPDSAFQQNLAAALITQSTLVLCNLQTKVTKVQLFTKYSDIFVKSKSSHTTKILQSPYYIYFIIIYLYLSVQFITHISLH
jgi:hypothetical protein